jgi:hypothetical protein
MTTSVCEPSPLERREFDRAGLRSGVFHLPESSHGFPRSAIIPPGYPILLIRTDSHRARLCSRRYHADHSCDADDDPKDGQGAPQFVHAKRARGAFELKALGARRINLICRRVDSLASRLSKPQPSKVLVVVIDASVVICAYTLDR